MRFFIKISYPLNSVVVYFSKESIGLQPSSSSILCEEKQSYNQEATYIKSMDLRHKLKNLIKEEDKTGSHGHFGRGLDLDVELGKDYGN